MSGITDKKILAIAALGVMALLVFLQLQNQQSGGVADELIFPEMKAGLESVSEIHVNSLVSGSALVIVKVEGNWQFLEKGGYPADFESLSALLNVLADLKIAEKKTAKSENHARLGLASEGESAGVVVKVVANSPFELMLGDDAPSQGTFVRRPGDNQVYLSQQTLEVSTDLIDYVDPVFFNLDAAEVKSVRIETADSAVSAMRDSDGEMTIKDLPDGAELRYEAVADSLARIFVNLRFEDVQPYRADFIALGKEATVTTIDDAVFTFQSAEIDGEYWVQLDEEWQYKVSQYTYNELNKSMQDMLKADEDDGI